ncbi:hypothetical protein DFS33DRAFT_1262866, partial [Desarmillaria ectypa]
RDVYIRYVGGGIGHGADPKLEDNDSVTEAETETTHEIGTDEPDDEAAVGKDTEGTDEGEDEDQRSEDSGDENPSEDGTNFDASVESSYLNVEDIEFSDL